MEAQNRLGPIVEDYLDRLRNGEKVSARHYAEQYPEMATEILDFLPVVEMLADIKRPLPPESLPRYFIRNQNPDFPVNPTL